MSYGLSFALSALLVVGSMQEAGFTGLWKRNIEQSDDAQQKMQEAMAQMGGRGGGGRPPGGGGGGGGKGGKSGEGGRGDGGTRPDLGNIPDEMTVELVGGELQVDDGERLHIYYLDGEKHKRETPNGGKLESVAEHKGNAVIIEEKMERGQIDRKFELSPAGDMMILTVTVKLGQMKDPVVIKTVYERASGHRL